MGYSSEASMQSDRNSTTDKSDWHKLASHLLCCASHWRADDKLCSEIQGYKMIHFKRLTETLVTALFLSLLLTTITSAVDVPLPEGGTAIPPPQWPQDQQPPQGQYEEKDADGRTVGVWMCITWAQLPPTANTTCGYADIYTMGPPASDPPFTGAKWYCCDAPNVLTYRVPFNKGACFWTASPQPGRHLPTAE